MVHNTDPNRHSTPLDTRGLPARPLEAVVIEHARWMLSNHPETPRIHDVTEALATQLHKPVDQVRPLVLEVFAERAITTLDAHKVRELNNMIGLVMRSEAGYVELPWDGRDLKGTIAMLYTLARQSEFQTDITLCSSNPQERSIKVFVKPRTADEISREIHSSGVEKLVPGVSYHGVRLATLTEVLRLGLTTEDLAKGKRAFDRETNSALVPAELRDTCYKFKIPWSVRTNGEKRGGVASEVRGLKSSIDRIDSVCASGLPDPAEREQLQRMRNVLTELALNTRSNGFYSISVYESKSPSPHILVDLYRTVTHEGFHARDYALKASGKALTPQDMRGLVVRHPWIEASARTNGYGDKGLCSWIEEAMAHTVSGEGYSYVKSGVTLDVTKDPHAAYCDVIKLRDDFLKDYVVTWVKRNGIDGIRSLLPPESSAVRIAVDAGLRELSSS